MDNFKLKFGNYLENYKIDIITKIHHFRRSYLFTSAQPEKEEVEIWGEWKDNVDLDNLDIKILEVIDNNARMNSLENSRFSFADWFARDSKDSSKEGLTIISIIFLLFVAIMLSDFNKRMLEQENEQHKLNERIKIHEQLIDIKADMIYVKEELKNVKKK